MRRFCNVGWFRIFSMTAADVKSLRLQIGDHDIYKKTEAKHEERGASKVLFHKGFSMKHLVCMKLNVMISRNVGELLQTLAFPRCTTLLWFIWIDQSHSRAIFNLCAFTREPLLSIMEKSTLMSLAGEVRSYLA
jgi:hypothetical protein